MPSPLAREGARREGPPSAGCGARYPVRRRGAAVRYRPKDASWRPEGRCGSTSLPRMWMRPAPAAQMRPAVMARVPGPTVALQAVAPRARRSRGPIMLGAMLPPTLADLAAASSLLYLTMILGVP